MNLPSEGTRVLRAFAYLRAVSFANALRHRLRRLKQPKYFLGASIMALYVGLFFIGPQSERWDRAMLVRQSSVQSFLAFASHEGYLAGYGHRLAAIADSRLLPLVEMPSGAGLDAA